MDVSLFLQLPTDIRREVYYHLNGSFSHLETASLNSLYKSDSITIPETNVNKSKHEKKILRTLYKVFAPYIEIFEYNPKMVQDWLEYSLWLRYDSIVLDCLRLNHAYDGTLIGPVDWLYLSSRLRLGYFNQDGLLQVWYTQHEYNSWIIEADSVGEYNPVMEYSRFNMEFMKPAYINNCLEVFERKKLFNSMYQIMFQKGEDHFMETSDNKLSETLSTNLEPVGFSSRESSLSPSISRESSTISNLRDEDSELKHMTKKRKVAASNKEKYNLNDVTVINVLDKLNNMKNLEKIGTRGDDLYDRLINGHGIRDRRNNTINYLIKRRIQEIDVIQVSDITKYGFSDFSKWDNLQKLSLINIGKLNLNEMILPKFCKSLVLKNIISLRWFDILNVLKMNGFNEDELLNSCMNSTSTPCELKDCNHIKLLYQDEKRISVENIQKFQKIAWKPISSINYICLQNISEVINSQIVLPITLCTNDRIKIFSCTNLQSVLAV